MLKGVKRIIALFSTFAICLSLFVVPAYAVPALPSAGTFAAFGFADFVLQYMKDHADEAISGGINKIHRIFDSDVCTSGKAENGRHKFVQQTTAVDGQTGEYYVCEYCGKSGGEVFDSAYDSYVGDLPASAVDSDGSLYWVRKVSSLKVGDNVIEGTLADCVASSSDYVYAYFNEADNLQAPFNGSYTIQDVVDNFYYLSNGEYKECGLSWQSGSGNLRVSKSNDGSSYSSFTNGFYLGAGDSLYLYSRFRIGNIVPSSDNPTAINYAPLNLVVKIFPSSALDVASDDTFGIDTRPGTITGKYLVQNGDAYEDSSTTIINEDDNSIYNPVTNTTTNYDSWSYDYSTRTYTMTDNTNNSVSTVTYGDENITINEGGNTYNVYYGTVINNNGGDDSGNGGNNGGGTDIDFPSNTGIDTLGERLKVYFQRLPEMMGDINNFLSDAFPYIPQDLLYLIEFSLTISLFMAIIKMIRR